MSATQKSVLTKSLLLLAVGAILLPLALVALIIAEHAVFGTRYFSDCLEAVGLTPLLQKIFTFLDING